jgi:limonene-1,2-epoxide hydrolase
VTEPSDRERQVRGLLASFGLGREAGCAEVRRLFADDCRWEVPRMAATIGPQEAIEMIEGFESAAGIHRTEMDVITLAVNGDAVLVEYLGRAVREDGSTIMEIPALASLRFEGDQLVSWREYFDPGLVPAEHS